MNPFRLGVVVLVALVLQVCLFSRFSYEGARPDVMILVAIAAGLVAGAERGALVGFVAGLAYDVVLTTPLGLSALVYCLVGYAVGASGSGVLLASVNAVLAPLAVRALRWARLHDADRHHQPLLYR